MLSRGWAYIVKAGTIILLCNTAVQLMQSFNWSFQLVEEGMEPTSILGLHRHPPVSVLLIPSASARGSWPPPPVQPGLYRQGETWWRHPGPSATA